MLASRLIKQVLFSNEIEAQQHQITMLAGKPPLLFYIQILIPTRSVLLAVPQKTGLNSNTLSVASCPTED